MTSVTGVHAPDPTPPVKPIAAKGTGRLGDRLFSGAAGGAGGLVVVLVILIGVFLLSQALPALARNQANFLTSTEWTVSGDAPRFGVAGLLWVTVASSVIAMLLAVPVGVAVALFLTQYAPVWLAKPAAATIDLLAAVPSIVFGLWGLNQFGPFIAPIQGPLARLLGWIPLFAGDPEAVAGNARTILIVGVVLAIMILPIVTALSREVFAQTPKAHIEGALALGATQWETIRTAVLPFGQPGVISAAMLGLGRALGETLAVTIILVTANSTGLSTSLFLGGETFASKIANNASEFDTPQKTGAFLAAGLVLFLLTFVVNAIARIVIERRKAFTE